MKVPFVDLGRTHTSLTLEDALKINGAANEVIRSGKFILGPEVGAFEEKFANYCGTKYCIGVDSGTSAIELALTGLNIGQKGTEVITVPNTFFATAYAIARSGATPVFVDVDPDTLLMNHKNIPNVLTDMVGGIVPVHLFGNVVDIDSLKKYNVPIVEDDCQAHGAVVNGKVPITEYRRVGSLGMAGAFSFYPAKNMGAFGDSGAVVTNDDKIACNIRMLRDYGQREKYFHDMLGGNHRLDTIQAAVLLEKLRCLDRWNELRVAAAKQYDKELPSNINMVKRTSGGVCHLYVIRVSNREKLQQKLSEAGISTGIHYPVPLHLTKAFKYLGYKEGDFPIAERAAKEVLSLPMFPGIHTDEISYVCDTIRKHYKNGKHLRK